MYKQDFIGIYYTKAKKLRGYMSMNSIKEVWSFVNPVTGETFESEHFDIVVRHISVHHKVVVPLSIILLGRLAPTLTWTDTETGIEYTISNKLL